ncbi:MAG: type IV secretory system conjugative DNA transfer family protein [Clostridia bacterium]
MSNKKKSSILTTWVIPLIGSLAFAFIIVALLVTFMNGKGFTFDNIIESIKSGSFLSFFVIAAVLSIILLISIKSKTSSAPKMKGKDELENRRFLREDELDKNFPHYTFEELKDATVVGVPIRAKFEHKHVKVHFIEESHMMVIGATGTGKSAYFLDPTIQILTELKTKPSFFITDTKGELFAHNSKNMLEKGYDIKLLDFSDSYVSMRWNPLEDIYVNYQASLHMKEKILKHMNDNVKSYTDLIKVGDIQDEEWYEFAGKAFSSLRDALEEVEVEKNKLKDSVFEDLSNVCQSIVPITEGSNQASWDQGAQDYLKAVLIAMLEDSEDPELGMTIDRYNMYNATKIALNKANDFEDVKKYFQGRSPTSITQTLSSHIVATKATTTRDGYLSQLSQALSIFSDMGVCYVTSKNEIDFENFDEKPTAFFIKIPDEKKSRYVLATICIAQAYQRFVAKARANEAILGPGKARLKRPLFYLMDEFANLPKVPQIGTMLAVSRGRNITFTLIIQSYSQLDGKYGKDEANTIKSNCKTTLYLGTPDLQTNKEFSESLGNYTIEVQSSSKTPGQSDQKGGKTKDSTAVSTQFQSRPLIYPSDLVDLEMGKMIAIPFKTLPVKTEFSPWFKHKDYYNIGKMDMPYVSGKRLNEQAIFYDINRRNAIVFKD